MNLYLKVFLLTLGLYFSAAHLSGQSITVSPNSGAPGSSFAVTVTGVGTSWAASPTHCVQIYTASTTLSFTGTTVSSTTLTGTLSIPLGTTAGAYQARVFSGANCTGSTNGTCTNCFTVVTPTFNVSPTSGTQGHTQTLTFTGSGTNWTTGSTHCISLTSGGTTLNVTGTASSATSISGSLTLPFSATAGSYDIKIYDDNAGQCSGNALVCTECYAVTPTANIAFAPNSGSLGSVFPVSLSVANLASAGASTHCVELKNGSTTLSFTANKANGDTTLTGTISVPANATLGFYSVIVYPDGAACLGNNIGYCDSCFKVITLPLALDKIEAELAFSLFPNPSQDDAVTVSFGKPLTSKVSLAVYDLMGKRVISPTTLAPNSTEAVLDIAKLPAGMYLIATSQNGVVLTRRFVRQ